ncbi:MAG: GTPase-associated system all-helical protein GASH [Solirubrobacteraceae bacterium]
MSVEPHAFDFTDAYRTLQPSASWEVVADRESSHGELLKKVTLTTHVLDLCRLAFGMTIPEQSELGSSLVAEVRKSDKQFSLKHDRAEAGRLCALLLAERLAGGSTQDAFAVLATSFAGQRASADEDALTNLAGQCLTRSARARGRLATQAAVTYQKAQDHSSLIAALEPGVTPPAVKAIFQAMMVDDQAGGQGLANVMTTVVRGLLDENQRLAEEVDLLWWHIGDWSECLGRPLGQVPETGRGLIAGADLAAIIRDLPGPYGTAGILRRSLSQEAEQPMTLREAVEALEHDDLKRAYASVTDDTDILPVHTAVQLCLDRGHGAWGQAFEKVCKVNAEAPLTRYKIALQAFWEQSLVKHGWAK